MVDLWLVEFNENEEWRDVAVQRNENKIWIPVHNSGYYKWQNWDIKDVYYDQAQIGQCISNEEAESILFLAAL